VRGRCFSSIYSHLDVVWCSTPVACSPQPLDFELPILALDGSRYLLILALACTSDAWALHVRAALVFLDIWAPRSFLWRVSCRVSVSTSYVA
jgi:hypothetical protein